MKLFSRRFKMTKREEQKEQRRIKILETALDLFIRKGYGETKIADIAKAANMSMGLLFHYFSSKEALYETLIKIGCEKLKMDLPISSDSSIEIFKTAAEDILTLITSSPFAAKMFVLMENANHLDILPLEVKQQLIEGDTIIQKSIPIIKEGQKRGEIKDGDPEALSVAFWCSIQGIAQHIALYPGAPCPQADWLVSILETKRRDFA